MKSHENPPIEEIISDPQFELAVIETAETLPDYNGNSFMYDPPKDKTRRGILMALEQAGVAYIPANQRYVVYENQEHLTNIFRKFLENKFRRD